MVNEGGRNPVERISNAVLRLIDGPITWFRGKLILLFFFFYDAFFNVVNISIKKLNCVPILHSVASIGNCAMK